MSTRPKDVTVQASPDAVAQAGVGPVSDDGAERRLAFIYGEALRGLNQQQAVIESLLNRAGILIFALSFANSLLGAKALTDGVGSWDWVALASLVGVGVLAVVVLWPYYNFWFRFDPRELIDRYVDRRPNGSMAAMHRELALRIEGDIARNWRIMRRMRAACQLALALLIVNLIAWLLSIAGASG